MAETIDKTDIQMLRVLQENARITVKDLALKVHLSPTPVFERLHRLEKDGFIRRYTAVLDAAKLGRGFLVFCSVRLRRMGKEIADDFVNRVKDIPEVAECYNISGFSTTSSRFTPRTCSTTTTSSSTRSGPSTAWGPYKVPS